MARKQHKWTTQHNYKLNRYKGPTWDQLRAKPEEYGKTKNAVAKQTTPGQTISVKELIKRYETGRPIPTE